MASLYVCGICGHIEFNHIPDLCPVCFTPKEKIIQDDAVIHPSAKEGKEKHVPVISVSNSCGLIPDVCQDVHVKVGSIPHPMEADHMIEWIDIYLDYKVLARYQLNALALQAAVGVHLKKDQHGILTVVEHCNKHGYWMSEVKL